MQITIESKHAKDVCLEMMQSLNVKDLQYRLGSTLILLKREVVDEMERKRAVLLMKYTIIIQKAIRQVLARAALEKKSHLRRAFYAALVLQSTVRTFQIRLRYAKLLGVVLEVKKRMSIKTEENIKELHVTSQDVIEIPSPPSESIEMDTEEVDDQVQSNKNDTKHKQRKAYVLCFKGIMISILT
jgi:myosin heavy subunit